MFTPLLKSPDPMKIGEAAMRDVVTFKSGSPKDDPARLPGLHGPYEELHLLKKGRLPDLYFDQGDPMPWGLRVEDSRSVVLWQVLSGVMDRQPEFASSYMALALDKTLSDGDYAKELAGLNKDFSKYMEHAGASRDHHHQVMGHIYKSVACPACTLLTSVAVRDPGMLAVFKEMQPLRTAERREFLQQRGLLVYLNQAVPSDGLKPDPAA